MTAGWSMEAVARLAAEDIPDGSYVNLGIGFPERVADCIPANRDVILHSENGILGLGPRPEPGQEHFDLINAGKKPASLFPGAAFFHHADSFAMIRGGHIDICIMGAFQVSADGDLANWSTGSGGIPAVGGAMDLATGARSVRVITSHCTKDGLPKLVSKLSLPPTGRGVVDRIYTELAVLRPEGVAFSVLRMAPECNIELLERSTGAPLRFACPQFDP